MKRIFTFSLSIALLALSVPSMAQWTDVSTGAAAVELFDVKFLDDQTGYVVGRNHNSSMGYVFKTTDGGATWSADSFANQFFRAVAFSSNSNGNIGGYDAIPATALRIFRSTDAGGTWTQQATSGSYLGIEHMQFVDANNGFASGYATTFGTSAGCYKTTDGGATWTNAGSIPSLGTGMEFLNTTVGFICTGVTSSSGTIQKTSDGGSSWLFTYSGPWCADVSTVGPDTVYGLVGLGSASIVKSTNQGNTFGAPLAVVGGVKALHFPDHAKAWAVGASGAIMVSWDRGNTWTAETSGTAESLNEITSSANMMWTCGTGGVVLKRNMFPTTVEENSNIRGVQVWPNPTVGNTSVRINAKSPVIGAEVALRNVAGQIVESFTTNIQPGGHYINIDLIDRPSGIYFVSVKAEGVNEVLKVVKQ